MSQIFKNLSQAFNGIRDMQDVDHGMDVSESRSTMAAQRLKCFATRGATNNRGIQKYSEFCIERNRMEWNQMVHGVCVCN